MNSEGQKPLLRDVLANPTLERLRMDSLTTMLGVARRRRNTRRAGTLFGTLCVIVAGLWIATQFPGWVATRSASQNGNPQQVATYKAAPAPPPSSSQTAPVIEHISDDELLALFPGRTVALVGPPGKQQLLVFELGPHDL